MKALGAVATGSALFFGVIAWRHWRRLGVSPRVAMGLERDRGTGVDLAAGLAIGSLVMAGVFCVEWGLGLVRLDGVGRLSAALVGWSLLMPLAVLWEEIAFRGLMLNGLVIVFRRRWVAVGLTAIAFGVAHLGNPHASVLSAASNAFGGAVYAIAFLGSGRLWLGYGLHLSWNLVQGPLLGFPVSGYDMHGLVEQSAVGPHTLTGGAYGPEGGVIGAGSRLVVLAMLMAWLSWRRGHGG